MVMPSAGDLGLEIDLDNDKPGRTLQRLHRDEWRDYRLQGKLVKSPVDIERQEPERYRLRFAERI